MQRGSSLRSHHIGACRGFSAASIDSKQLSTDDERSHRQSAALALDAKSVSSEMTATAGKEVLIEGESETPVYRARPRSQQMP